MDAELIRGTKKYCAAKKVLIALSTIFIHQEKQDYISSWTLSMVIREDYLHLALWIELEILEKLRAYPFITWANLKKGCFSHNYNHDQVFTIYKVQF